SPLAALEDRVEYGVIGARHVLSTVVRARIPARIDSLLVVERRDFVLRKKRPTRILRRPLQWNGFQYKPSALQIRITPRCFWCWACLSLRLRGRLRAVAFALDRGSRFGRRASLARNENRSSNDESCQTGQRNK